jgi:lipid A 3-O-deacylase
MKKHLFVLLLAFPALLPDAASGEHVINMLAENDLFTGTDSHYTSGVMANYISGVDNGPKRLKDMSLWFPGIDDDDKINVSISLGHELYTPNNIRIPTLLEEDRPYAAYAYLAAGFSTANAKEVETWRVSLGLVGPNAKGERIQNSIHQRIGSNNALGWDNQLKNE